MILSTLSGRALGGQSSFFSSDGDLARTTCQLSSYAQVFRWFSFIIVESDVSASRCLAQALDTSGNADCISVPERVPHCCNLIEEPFQRPFLGSKYHEGSPKPWAKLASPRTVPYTRIGASAYRGRTERQCCCLKPVAQSWRQKGQNGRATGTRKSRVLVDRVGLGISLGSHVPTHAARMSSTVCSNSTYLGVTQLGWVHF